MFWDVLTRGRSGFALSLGLAAGLGTLLMPTSVATHPHVWVTARAELVFDEGVMTTVRHVWQFDEAYTAFAIQGLDENDDGMLSDQELQPLAKVNVESLEEFDFFTFVAGGESEASFAPPTEYWLDFNSGKLTLFYALSLKTPLRMDNGDLTIEVFDPSYFVDFQMVKEDPVLATNLPNGCSLAFEGPEEIDSQLAATLAEIPATVTDLPPEFMAVTETLSNKATVSCP
ncbi:MAG: DUF1007 family protein [Pseudomonadota bacterium]